MAHVDERLRHVFVLRQQDRNMVRCQILPRSRNAEAALVRLAMCAAFANCAHAARPFATLPRLVD
jgi:hypothetical protein